MLLKIINYTDLRIRKISKLVKKNINYKFLFIIKEMIKLLFKNNGVGIASNQINFFKKIIIVDLVRRNKLLILINPFIILTNNFYTLGIEGCLSIKNIIISVPRFDKIVISYNNYNNKKKIKMFQGIISRCLQHEIDHLNGVLIIDYQSKILK